MSPEDVAARKANATRYQHALGMLMVGGLPAAVEQCFNQERLRLMLVQQWLDGDDRTRPVLRNEIRMLEPACEEARQGLKREHGAYMARVLPVLRELGIREEPSAWKVTGAWWLPDGDVGVADAAATSPLGVVVKGASGWEERYVRALSPAAVGRLASLVADALQRTEKEMVTRAKSNIGVKLVRETVRAVGKQLVEVVRVVLEQAG